MNMVEWPEGTEELLDRILTDAYGEDEQLWALRQTFEDNVELPADAFVVGEPVEVVEVDYDGTPRRGLTARCRRSDGGEHVVPASHVVFPDASDGARHVAAYRKWMGLQPAAAPEATRTRRQTHWDATLATNEWCHVLGINVPSLEAVKDHREANAYALLIVTLLECGEAMTLPEVAARFEEAGVAPEWRALLSLKRCKPGRAPIYRDGDHYQLDPHDDALDLWVFRLGLRPPKIAQLRVVRPEPEPLPDPGTPLTVDELDEAWPDASLRSWSDQRLALAVLEASGGPMMPDDVVAFVAERTRWHYFRNRPRMFTHHGSPVRVLDDGRWSIAPDADEALQSARKAVRARLETARRHAAMRPDPAVIEARIKMAERERAARGLELAKLRRVLLVAFPAKKPGAVTLLDVNQHEIETLVDHEIGALPERLAAFDIIGAMDVRVLLRTIGFDPGERRLAELGPPQKRKKLNKSGRTLKITTALLVRGSCGISRPFGDVEKFDAYLRAGQHTKLRRRLEADAKSLYALYQYGRLHGAVRLRWGFLDERIPAPWVHRDEPKLYNLKEAALETRVPLEVVVGTAPGWEDPWSRARLVRVEKDQSGWYTWLADELGVVDEAEIQLARLSTRTDTQRA